MLLQKPFLNPRNLQCVIFGQEAEKAKDPPRTLWDESTGKSLAEFFNKIRGDSLVAEMGAEEGRTLSTSELILLVQVGFAML